MSKEIRKLVESLEEGRVGRRDFIRRALALGLTAGTANVLLAACAPAPAPTAAPAPAKPAAPAPTTAPAAPAAPAATAPPAAAAPKPTAAAANALDQIVEAAKKEGAVSLIDATAQAPTREAMAKGYRKMFGLPDSFKVEHTTKSTAEVSTSVTSEIKAGKVTFDVFWVVGVDTFKAARQANELLSYVPREWESATKAQAEKLMFEYDAPYFYPTHFYTFMPVWNRKKISKELTSWADVLDVGPSLKGRLVVGDVTKSSSIRDAYIGTRTKIDVSYWQKLKAQYDPMLVVRVDEQLGKIITGEADLTTAGTQSRAYQAWQSDKSLDWGVMWPKEGLTTVQAHAAILAKAPHPNAGKLMMEYILSKEGMQFWVNHELQWPIRTDYTIEGDLAKFMKHSKDVTWIAMDWSKVTPADRAKASDEFRKIFYGG